MKDKEIEGYLIVNKAIYFEVEKEVNDKIKRGFIPLGGVCYSSGGFTEGYSQAMIRYKNLNSNEG